MISEIDFTKSPDGLVPAIIQDDKTDTVLMLGYMNRESLDETINSERVTFYSRSKQRLWTKGESSGNFLKLVEVKSDCDNDSLLIKVNPIGPACHTGSDTCWNEDNLQKYGFLTKLEGIISDRQRQADTENSYVARLFERGINKIAQKVGEEAVETVIEAKDSNDERFLNESADLLFHLLILLKAKGFGLKDVVSILEDRHK